MHTYTPKRGTRTPQVVWDHGDERFNADGTTTQVSELRPLRARSLPRHMICTMRTTWSADGRAIRIELTRQARSKYARMHDVYGEDRYGDLGTAYEVAIKWAGRILRERVDEVEWVGRVDYTI